jgi:NADH-quinone oxidoreductase subunit N
MDPATLKALAAGNTWGSIWPELSLGCLALLLLALEIILPRAKHAGIALVSIAGQLAVLAGLLLAPVDADHLIFNGLLAHTRTGDILRIFFVLASVLVTVLARASLARRSYARTEFHHIVLVATASMMLLVQSQHFLMLFVALETLTISLYILVSYYRSNAKTLEAGLKYLVTGALSSALLLFGIVLLYGVAGNPNFPGHSANSMQFSELAAFLTTNPNNFLASAGIVLVLAGVAFKIGAVPFQIWVPDVYQGAPTPVTALLAVASKAAGFAVLVALVTGPFEPYGWLTGPILTLMAAATLLFGNLAALKQHNVKRLLGLSGVSHAGFLLVAVASIARVPEAQGAILFYLYAYLIASFAVFGVMTLLAGEDDTEQELGGFCGLSKESPFLAGVLACGLGSLAGIPPLAGFMGKLFVFIVAFKAGHYGLLGVAIVGVAISIYYYFGWIRAAFFADEPPASEELSTRARAQGSLLVKVSLAGLAAASILLGFFQGPLGAWVSGR